MPKVWLLQPAKPWLMEDYFDLDEIYCVHTQVRWEISEGGIKISPECSFYLITSRCGSINTPNTPQILHFLMGVILPCLFYQEIFLPFFWWSKSGLYNLVATNEKSTIKILMKANPSPQEKQFSNTHRHIHVFGSCLHLGRKGENGMVRGYYSHRVG